MSFTRLEEGQKSTNRRIKPELNISPIKSNKFTHMQDHHENLAQKMIFPRVSSIRPPVLVNDVILDKLSQVLDQLKTNECSGDELHVPQTPGNSHFEICSYPEKAWKSDDSGQFGDSTLELVRNQSSSHLNNLDNMMDHTIHEIVLANKCLQTEDLDTSSFMRPKVLRKQHSKNRDEPKNAPNFLSRNTVKTDNMSPSTSSLYAEEQRGFVVSENLIFPNSSSDFDEPLLSAPKISDFNKTNVRNVYRSPLTQRVNTKSSPMSQAGIRSGTQRNSPFYVTQNEDPSAYISHSIKAHEQQLMHQIQSKFSHWRTFVRNLLSDSATGDDVAILFLNELESRKQMRSNLKQSNNEYLHKADEHILSGLKRSLSNSDECDPSTNHFIRPSRMQQLRILNDILSNC